MVKTMTLLLLASVLATLPGCARSQSPSASTATSPVDVNGTWTGSTTTGARTVTLQLKQSGTNVTGTLAGAGVADGPIDGIVDGNVIKLARTTGAGSTPWLHVKGDLITGDLGSGTIVNLRRIR